MPETEKRTEYVLFRDLIIGLWHQTMLHLTLDSPNHSTQKSHLPACYMAAILFPSMTLRIVSHKSAPLFPC
ncbi:hypothetical protein PISMIDRAFT_689365, partial [Pisolithus microcarpus 441]